METRYEHITVNADHVPSIVGTPTKVVELVVDQQAYGWSPEELHFQHPHLTLGQIHSALAYYWDHREELSDLVDVWEAANRDDLFSVTSLKHYPYVANSDFHKPKHLYSWKTLLRCEKNRDEVKQALRRNVDVALTLYREGECSSGLSL